MSTITIRYSGQDITHQVNTFCKKCGRKGISVTIKRWTNGSGGSHRREEIREELAAEAKILKEEGGVCQLCQSGGVIDPTRLKQAVQKALLDASQVPPEKRKKYAWKSGVLFALCRQRKTLEQVLTELGVEYREEKQWGSKWLKIRIGGDQTRAEADAFVKSMTENGFGYLVSSGTSWEQRRVEYLD